MSTTPAADHHKKLVFRGGFGERELGKPERVDENTLFMATSNTKGMTTLLPAEMVDQGKLRWDEPVVEAYPPFKLGDAEATKKAWNWAQKVQSESAR